MDVRAPSEYQRGTLYGAQNLPLLDDKQRELIGTEYAQNGQQAAIELGHAQVTAELKQSLLRSWTEFTRNNSEGYLFCFRGGLRSTITQQWLSDAGVIYPKVIGGYKAMRQFLLEQFEQLAHSGNMLVLAAPTGSGKTHLIQSLSQSVDIEGMALHRGSAFGSLFVEQPSQASWENTVAAEWFRVARASAAPVMFESESHLIGRISLPAFFQNALRDAPVVELITPDCDRIRQIREDYITTAMNAFRVAHSEDESLAKLEQFISDNLGRIQRRLGGEKYQRLVALVPSAVNEIRLNLATESMDEIVRTLLHDYYDPLYAHKMLGREEQVVFSGSAAEIRDWLSRA